MIGLDTNILLRFLLQDDAVQSPIATRIIETDLSEQSPGFVSSVVLAETAWVLESRYRLRQSEIAAVMEGLLRVECLRLEHPSAVAVAVAAASEANADFADAMIGAVAQNAGCATTLTFDRRAQRLPGFSAA